MLSNILLYAGVVPFAVSAAITFIVLRLRCPAHLAWPAAIAGGFIAGRFALRSQSGFAAALQSFIAPHETIDWLPLIVLLSLGVSMVMKLSGPSQRHRTTVLAAALSVAVPIRLLSGNVRVTHWSMLEKTAYLLLLAAILGAIWLLLAADGDDEPAWLRVPLLVLVAIGTAFVLTQSGALIYGLTCAALAASITGAALTSLTRPGLRGGAGSASAFQQVYFHGIAGAAGVLTFSLGSLIVVGHFYAEQSATTAMLLFLSLAATAAPFPAIVDRGPLWCQLAVRSAVCVVPLSIALITAFT